MVFLGWKSEPLVVLYFLDTVVSVVCLAVLLATNMEDIEADSPPTGPRRRPLTSEEVAGFTFALGMLLVVIGIATAMPVYSRIEHTGVLHERSLWVGAVLQSIAAAQAHRTMQHQLRPLPASAAAPILKGRVVVVLLRWVALFVVALVLPWAPLMVLAYAGASVWFELRPARMDLI
jgi:hypothetical protein